MRATASGGCRPAVGTRCCIVPPKLFRRIALLSDDPDRRRIALESLAISSTFASARLGLAASLDLERALLRTRRALLGRFAGASGGFTPRRTIFDAHHLQRLPGTRVRSEGGPPVVENGTQQNPVNEAYDGFGATHRFYSEIYGRDSINDQGMPLLGTVHYGRDYANAFFDGRQMAFGDGDGDLFERFTISVDIIAHELTHGVVDREAGFPYWREPGALNESIADVFGSLVKQYQLGQKADEADWLIGAGLFKETVNGVALRSLKAPGTAYDDEVLGKDQQPSRMPPILTVEDNGGVHDNSGIPNHAFYIIATEIGGFAWETAGLIWYETLTSPALRPNTDFATFARRTVLTARRLYGRNSSEEQAVRHGWAEVEVPL